MRETITPDLSTLATYLAPDSSRATRVKCNPQTGETAELFQAIGLALPGDFFMTEFDALVLNTLYHSGSAAPITSVISEEFAKRGIQVAVNRSIVDDYLGVIRGNSIMWKKDKERPVWSGNFPTIRARYNAMRMLETDEWADCKRPLQYITATHFSEGQPALEVGEKLGIKTPSPIVDMMILDLFETAPDELNEVVEQCTDEFSSPMYKNGPFFKEFIENFKTGKVLIKAPRTWRSRFDQTVNQAVSNLWLLQLEKDKESFKPENMEYVRQALEIFVRGDQDTDLGPASAVEAWMKQEFGACHNAIGCAVINTVMGLDIYCQDVRSMIDKGLDSLNLPKVRINIL